MYSYTLNQKGITYLIPLFIGLVTLVLLILLSTGRLSDFIEQNSVALRVSLAPSNSAKAAVYAEIAKDKLAEANTLSQSGQSSEVLKTLDKFDSYQHSALTYYNASSLKEKNDPKLVNSLTTNEKNEKKILDSKLQDSSTPDKNQIADRIVRVDSIIATGISNDTNPSSTIADSTTNKTQNQTASSVNQSAKSSDTQSTPSLQPDTKKITVNTASTSQTKILFTYKSEKVQEGLIP